MGGTAVALSICGCLGDVSVSEPDPDDDNGCEGGSEGAPGWLCGGAQESTPRGLGEETAATLDVNAMFDPSADSTIDVYVDGTISGCLSVTSHATGYTDDIGLDTVDVPIFAVLTTPHVNCGIGFVSTQQNHIVDMTQEEFLTDDDMRVNFVGPMTGVLLADAISDPSGFDPADAEWSSGPTRTWGQAQLVGRWISTWEGFLEGDPVVINLAKYNQDDDAVIAGTFARGAAVLNTRRRPSSEEKQTMRSRFIQLLSSMETL